MRVANRRVTTATRRQRRCGCRTGESAWSSGRGDGTEPEEISFVFEFKYLGHWFQSDADGTHNIEIQMAEAGSAFGRLNHIWRDKRLSKRVKIKIYATFLISILVWGLVA
jgi:hypothetical protein